MICILCLETSIDFISISDNESGLNVASIISKHFWLKPQENDSDAKYICYECWHIVKSFHIFHTKIEMAHKNLTILHCKLDPLEDNEIVIKTENIENDSITCLVPSDSEDINIISNREENAEKPSNWTDSKRRTRKPVKYSESPEKELIHLEVGKRRRIKKIVTSTKVPVVVAKQISVPLQIETENSKNGDDSEKELIHLEVGKRRRIKKIVTSTKVPVVVAKQISVPLQIETENSKNGDDSDFLFHDIDQIDDDNEEKMKLKRRRNVLRNADEVDEKIAKFMQLICELCQTICPTLAALKAHFRSAHETKGYAICCKKKFFKRYLLIDHIDTHINPEHFKCTECDKIFTVADCLKRHIQELHKTEKCYYYCEKCPKKFVRQMLLDRHKAHHNPIEMWTFTCDDCGKSFPSKFYLKSHKTFTHNKLPNKICHICGKAIPSNRYKKHIMEHDGITEPKIQCEICGAWLQKKYMGTHKINHREAEIIHSCSICGKISPNRRALYIHMRYTHAEERNHECTVCSKTFKRRLALKQHMATHTGDNLYKCPYCPKSFTYDSNFHNHKKKEHPKEHEEERKRNQRTDFVKCTQEKLQNN